MTSQNHSPEFLEALRSRNPFAVIAQYSEQNTLIRFAVDYAGILVNAWPQMDVALRGRATFIGDVIYVVIDGNHEPMSTDVFYFLRCNWPRILGLIKELQPHLSDELVGSAEFIDENGHVLSV